ncbi:MAG: putative lipid II flippase FtsW [Gammaproteobacteria bacterium]|nr:putative lipid II flippase FtsW [Gammaproteobacteria bacterium]MCW9088868.1 putative lipid II flippase FtsW [Gammaproteobacteria bacterium]
MTAVFPGNRSQRRGQSISVDWWLLIAALSLLGLGLVMTASASVGIADRQVGDPSYYLVRQALYVGLGLAAALVAWQVPLKLWEKSGPLWVLVCIVLLLALFVPGLGRTVNGSTRWLMMGPFNLQVSELVKLAMVIYLAGYLVRRGEQVRNSISGFLKPMALVLLFGALLLAEPDFGAAVVLGATALGMMFLGGVKLWLFGLLLISATGSLALLAITSPYRLERLTAFLNPWADPFNSGFQLTQALIAFGRGEWFGVGLGASVQKLFYLPEAHTDFVYAVLVEELGMVGGGIVVLLFLLLVGRIFHIASNAARTGMYFASYLCYGVGIWFALQAFINMGVNMGLLPTKGLTLPLMSYGGSSMMAMCVALALVQRVAMETPQHGVTVRRSKA